MDKYGFLLSLPEGARRFIAENAEGPGWELFQTRTKITRMGFPSVAAAQLMRVWGDGKYRAWMPVDPMEFLRLAGKLIGYEQFDYGMVHKFDRSARWEAWIDPVIDPVHKLHGDYNKCPYIAALTCFYELWQEENGDGKDEPEHGGEQGLQG